MAEKTPMEQQVKEDISDSDSFDLSKKKKKKKKKTLVGPLDKLAKENTRSLSITGGVGSDSFGFRKNKNNPAEPDVLGGEHADPGHNVADLTPILSRGKVEEEEEEDELGVSRYPLVGIEGDYGYEKLLGRVFSILRENNPELAEDRRRTVLRPAEVVQERTTRTAFVNFMDLCETMHRHPEHFMTFLLAEIGTSGSLDRHERLVFKGRFASKSIVVIVRRYIDEYVICNTCKSPDTILTHEDCLYFLGCEQCGSEQRVSYYQRSLFAGVEQWTGT